MSATRLTLAAFLISTWWAAGLCSGTARADSPPPSGADSTSQSSPDAQHAASPGSSPATMPGSPSSPGLDTPRVGRNLVRGDSPTRASQPSSRVRSTRHLSIADITGQPSRSRAKDADAAPTEAASPVDRTEAVEKPAADHEPQVRPRGARPGLRLVATTQPPHSAAQADDRQLEPATVARIDPAAPSIRSGVSTVELPQVGRQAVGLASDVGVVAMSAVYTVADTIASAFGPDSFAGVPYALATAVANAAAAGSRALIGAPFDAVGTGPFPVTYGVINGLTFVTPQRPPPGANDPSLTVTAEHPLPIILLNGTTATQGTNWAVGAPVLANAGYKVYTFNYGNVTGNPNSPIQATDDIRVSARQLDEEVDRVLSETGAPKVILIGHSQGGGILPAYYINNVDGAADKVSQVIGIAPSNHGTDVDGFVGLLNVPVFGPLAVAVANVIGPALIQQTVGSPFQQEVYGSGDTRPGVRYTTIISTNDEVVTPYTQQALNGPNVTNIVLQKRYPGLLAGHLGVVLSPQVWSVVLEELQANPEANPQLHPQESAELAA